MPKLPQVSGKKLIKLLTSLDYVVVRQRGSHIRLKKSSKTGPHSITVPLHETLAKGTLTDILSKISIWNEMPKENLLNMLKKL